MDLSFFTTIRKGMKLGNYSCLVHSRIGDGYGGRDSALGVTEIMPQLGQWYKI